MNDYFNIHEYSVKKTKHEIYSGNSFVYRFLVGNIEVATSITDEHFSGLSYKLFRNDSTNVKVSFAFEHGPFPGLITIREGNGLRVSYECSAVGRPKK